MDILKLNKTIIAFSIILSLTSCYDQEKERLRGQKICDCESSINFGNKIVILKSNGLKLNKNGIKISHIRDGKIIENLPYEFKDFDDRWLSFVGPHVLFRKDSIKISFENGKEFILHDFVYNTYFGGKLTRGCEIEYCNINDINKVLIRDRIFL